MNWYAWWLVFATAPYPVVSEMGEICPWPFEPLTLTGHPIGMYHCSYCGDMQVAGMAHSNLAGAFIAAFMSGRHVEDVIYADL